MVLTLEQIKEAILNNPSKAVITKAAEKNKHYRMHFYGENLNTSLPIIKGFEEPGLHELRAKYSKSNKDLFARLSRPLDKIFSARGGSIYYNLSDNESKKASAIAANIKGGMSVKNWVRSYWMPHFNDDPDGMIFMELADGYAYPTYKSSGSVHSWLPNGDKFEYVIFKVSTEEKRAAGIDAKKSVYRVIDDAYDQYVYISQNTAVSIQGQIYNNPWGHVPAIRNSSMVDPSNSELMLSIFDAIMELADEFLLKGSIKITHEFLHAYPKYWEFADDCTKCKGTGRIDGRDCKECNGSGKSSMRKVNQVKLLNWPENDDFNPAPHLGGYIEPSETFYKISSAGLEVLEDAMHYTIWSKEPTKRTTGLESNNADGAKTATEIIEGQSPMYERLHEISDQAEKIIKFIIDHFVEIEVKPNYEGASVNLGRRYITENSDTIWKRYISAKGEGAPAALLDELYREFIESKYASDPLSMDIMIKLMGVEPFRHFSIEQVKTMGIGDDVYKQKVFYSEWLNLKNDNELIIKTVEQLREDLKAFAIAQQLAPKPEKENVAL